jgi:thiol-disulfide isomerase/thioredoxin
MPGLAPLFLASTLSGAVAGSVEKSPAPASPSLRAASIEVLAINGGGTPSGNSQSHLLHLRELVDLLRSGGVPERRITILSGDGADPAADQALREVQPEEDYWLLSGTRLERPFKTPVVLENSAVPGFTLRPATRVEVGRWFSTTGARLRAGDTLLLYVTDHGTKNAQDTRDNRITLWGKGEWLSVSQLGVHLGKLDPGARVVMLMSQCYSGSFANLAWRSWPPAGNVSGYFSTNAERPSYGCYPENRGVDNVGHSFDFLQGLAAGGSFRNAHLHTLSQDATPDVPLRTSDLFLEELLRRRSAEKGVELDSFVDSLLAQAWRKKAQWEPEIRLLDAIGRNFGSFSPRALAELREQSSRLPAVSEQLSTHAKAWKTTLGDVNRGNLDRLLASRTSWAERLDPARLKDAGVGGAREVAIPFLSELAEHTRADAGTAARLAAIRAKADAAAAAAYRMEVRLGVVLRMRAVLVTTAGSEYLARHGTDLERAAYAALLEGEGLTLPLGKGPPLAEMAPFPSLEDDLALAREVLPAWLGIRFRETPQTVRTAERLARGAASVTAVFPDSPAEEAGLEVGDVILGPPGAPFQEPQQVREWTMLATVDEAVRLELLREGERLEVTLVPRAYPLKWPELPGPPRVSSAAPAIQPLRLTAYRGQVPSDLGAGTPYLLFYWATWCGPCKAAVPELLAFEQERRTPVVAITDEPAETLDAFFSSFGKPFPERVATDEARRAFLAYGVSGTPTFVLVDGDGTIRWTATGYSLARGLGIEGWTWAGRPASGRSSSR